MSIQPRKERKRLYNAPAHRRRKQVAAHLSNDLILKYDRRSITLRKGDEVVVLRGEFADKTKKRKVLSVDTTSGFVTLEGVTIETAKHAKKARPIHPSNLVIARLDLSDPRRRNKLGVKEEEVSPEERVKPKKERKAPKEDKEKEEDEEKEERGLPGARKKKGAKPDEESDEEEKKEAP